MSDLDEDRALLERLGVSPGLCSQCRHRRLLRSRRSVFLLCERSKSDPAYPRYPRLPVPACLGFEPHNPPAEDSAI